MQCKHVWAEMQPCVFFIKASQLWALRHECCTRSPSRSYKERAFIPLGSKIDVIEASRALRVHNFGGQ